jgi:glycine betaine/proline transport system substrate-binding protein
MPVRFISCPADWACSVINRNLIKAYGLSDLVQLVEPANRFEMDALIAEAVSRRENFVLYYWQPNAVLAQLDFRALDMGAYDEEAMKCLARLACATPTPSAFPAETVVIALAEWVFTEAPSIASYFQRATLPITEMNEMLGQLNEPGATLESVAERFVAARSDVWRAWLGAATP